MVLRKLQAEQYPGKQYFCEIQLERMEGLWKMIVFTIERENDIDLGLAKIL